jgi:hypothetical protein
MPKRLPEPKVTLNHHGDECRFYKFLNGYAASVAPDTITDLWEVSVIDLTGEVCDIVGRLDLNEVNYWLNEINLFRGNQEDTTA